MLRKVMGFINKKEEAPKENVHVEFATEVPGLEEIAPPLPASRCMPSSFDSMPLHVKEFNHRDRLDQTSHGAGTLRRCPGVADYMKIGYILPLWADYIIEYDSGRGELNWSSPSPWAKISFHSISQVEGTDLAAAVRPYRGVIKFESPWRVMLPKGYTSLMISPFFDAFTAPYQIVPGVVDHDDFHVSNVLAVWRLHGSGRLLLRRGTPLAQIIPIKREGFESEVRTMNDGDKKRFEMEKLVNESHQGEYRKTFWKKKHYN